MKLLCDLDRWAYPLGLPRLLIPIVTFIYPATWAVVVYRFGNFIAHKDKVIKYTLFIIYFVLKRLVEILTTIDISEKAEIGEGLYIAHMGCIVIGGNSKIGKNLSVRQGVTIGGRGRGEKYGHPTIGDNLLIGAGGTIIGKVSIGDYCAIGANAVVTHDLHDYEVAVGIPARVISKDGSYGINIRNR